ncbi:hypothetical protein, partial [uncultured Duncaniella sp.]
MNLVIANTNATAFAVSRALNCTDRTDCGAYTNDTGTIVITSVDPNLVGPAPYGFYANGADFIKTLPFIPETYLCGIRAQNRDGKFKVCEEDMGVLRNLRSLMMDAAEVIFASNGGCMAQALFSILCQNMKNGRRTSRMWLTTLSNRAISYAYRNREHGRNLTRIARAG